MSKFKVGDHVRVTFPKHSQFDRAGNVIEVFDEDTESAAVYRVRFPGVMVKQLCEGDLTLADPEPHKEFVSVGTESNPITIRLTDHQAPGYRDITEQEIDGDYERGGSADHAATLKTMAQGLAAEMDAAQRAHREAVTAPSHYTSHPSGVEAITITRHESFLRGNVLKYVLRAPYKGSELQDLRKGAQYLQWEIERAEAAL